jgi:hypothetical protein
VIRVVLHVVVLLPTILCGLAILLDALLPMPALEPVGKGGAS